MSKIPPQATVTTSVRLDQAFEAIHQVSLYIEIFDLRGIHQNDFKKVETALRRIKKQWGVRNKTAND